MVLILYIFDVYFFWRERKTIFLVSRWYFYVYIYKVIMWAYVLIFIYICKLRFFVFSMQECEI